MSDSRTVHRLHRARVDPIDTPYCALSLILDMMDPAIREQTIALLLDHERRGLGVIVIGGTGDPESVLGVADSITEQARQRDEVGGLVLASIRPRGGAEYRDLDRWADIDDLCEQAGIEFVEWFVLGTTISCPRELCGEPPRWRS